MKYYRFMSEEEFQKLINGEVLINNNKHEKCRTQSKGFCFLREDSCAISLAEYTEGEVYGMHPSTWRSYLGVDSYATAADLLIGGTCGSDKVFVEFESSIELNKSIGTYADQLSDIWEDLVMVDEYCTQTYNSAILHPLRAWRKTDIFEWDEEILFTALEPDYWEDKYGD